MFNFINTSRKIRGGENRKTEIQKKGVGGGRISLFVLFYYNLQRWSKGVGVLGSPVMPRPPFLAVLACRSSTPPSSCYPSPDKPTAFFKRYWFFSSGDIMLSAKWSVAAE